MSLVPFESTKILLVFFGVVILANLNKVDQRSLIRAVVDEKAGF